MCIVIVQLSGTHDFDLNLCYLRITCLDDQFVSICSVSMDGFSRKYLFRIISIGNIDWITSFSNWISFVFHSWWWRMVPLQWIADSEQRLSVRLCAEGFYPSFQSHYFWMSSVIWSLSLWESDMIGCHFDDRVTDAEFERTLFLVL